jgi:hypothetical protein
VVADDSVLPIVGRGGGDCVASYSHVLRVTGASRISELRVSGKIPLDKAAPMVHIKTMKNTNTTQNTTSNRKCLCGASTIGSFTNGFHHGAHLCALTITTNHPRAGR